MEALLTDQDLDQFIWNCIENSTNARDFVDYLNHTYGTFAEQEAAYQKMLTYWGEADTPRQFDKAVAGLTEQAESGNALAMFHLGRWYRLGYGVEKNDDIGLGWYRKGAEAGSTRCLINLARYTALTDEPAANALFQKAVEMGDLYAHCYWADSDKDHYDKHLELGAQADDAFAKYCYAFHLNKLAQSDAEKQHALDLTKKAAELGEASACTFVYYQYMYGSPICTVDKEQAAWGTFVLGVSYENGHGVDKDPERAFALYMEAAKKKLIRAGYKVGMAYMWGEGVEEDIPAAAYWFKQAANGGDDDAQVQLGMMFIYGHGVEENVDKGFNWLQLSAEQDNPIALRELGFLHESGKGVALSMSEATRLISKAASLGDKKSIEWVDTNYPDKPDWLKNLCLDTSLKG